MKKDLQIMSFINTFKYPSLFKMGLIIFLKKFYYYAFSSLIFAYETSQIV